ncbi:MAG: XRE family transcriptional regulator, partial [Verrucomicrobiaceae bacterium]
MSDFRPTASYTVFLRHLVRVRIDSGTSPTELAKRLEIPVETVREIEAGKTPLDFVQTRAWCLAIGIDFTAFVLQVGKDIEANFAGAEQQSTELSDILESDDGDDPLFAEFDELEG